MTRLVFDTNVCGKLATSPNKVGIISHLRSRYKIAASANTLFELIFGLCRSSTEEHFAFDQERFQVAIGRKSYHHASFLDHGLVFALSHGPKIAVEDTGVGRKMFRDYTKLVLRAASLQQLKSAVAGVPLKKSKAGFLKCDVIESDLKNAKHFYRTDVYRPLPNRVTWAKNLGSIVGANLTDAQASNLGQALDGLYRYEEWLRLAIKGNFSPKKNENDRMDMHQLFYLADPAIEFITCDRRIRDRVEASHQRDRIVLLNELLKRGGLSLA